MKWFILLAVQLNGDLAPSPDAFFGLTACERGITEMRAMGFTGKAKCTPRRIK